MKILGLYWGLCSSAAITAGSRLVAAVSEERYTRMKNDDAFPEHAIAFCMKKAGLKPQELDGVAIAGFSGDNVFDLLARRSRWGVEDYLMQQYKVWRPVFYENKRVSQGDVFKDKFDFSIYPQWYWKKAVEHPDAYAADREEIVAAFLGIDKNCVTRVEHHRCHAAYSYYASPFKGEKVLVFTLDGIGDGLNATINIFDEQGNCRRVYATDQCNIGRIYRYITLLLGMKPNEHEYKVMGLAAYGAKVSEKAYNVFKETLYVDGLEFKWKVKPKDSYFWFKEKLEGCRFDGIAAGLQRWVETIITEWVRNACRKFNIRKVVLSGGVAMNVKANGRIMEIDEVDDFFVGGSPGDESMAISSCICLARDLNAKNNQQYALNGAASIKHLYLGPESDEAREKQALAGLDRDEFRIIDTFGPRDIALLLSEGNVIARCAGRMEFGARALGNRSILSDPLDTGLVERVNKMIKNRDFWMPFAPVIMDKYAKEYLINPKGIRSPYMTIAFKATNKGYQAMPAACHSADRTFRAQILKREDNPPLYEILEEFEKVTGRGALLNTSFNLHGEPVVNTPSEAVYVLKNSGLDGVLLNKFLILKVKNRESQKISGTL